MGGSTFHTTVPVTPTSAQFVRTATMVMISSTLSHTPMPLLVCASGRRLSEKGDSHGRGTEKAASHATRPRTGRQCGTS